MLLANATENVPRDIYVVVQYNLDDAKLEVPTCRVKTHFRVLDQL